MQTEHFSIIHLTSTWDVCGSDKPSWRSRAWVQNISNMAETTEGNVQQSSIQQHEAVSSEKDTSGDSEHGPSEAVLQGTASMDKPNISPGEVMTLKECCREAFGKLTEYLRGELAGKLMKRLTENQVC